MKYSLAIALLLTLGATVANAADYAVVVSADTLKDAGWKQVADALVAKHQGKLVTYDADVKESLPQLKQLHPRYTCFVAPPATAGREFVASVHQLTRQLDDDPYTDTIWGVLTGYNAENALSIARYETPLTVRKVASGTEFAMEMVEEGKWYDELVKNKLVMKQKGATVKQLRGPGDTTAALVDSLNEYKPDLFLTSGHATERNWQIGFTYRNGFFKCKAGQIFGEDTQKQRHDVNSPNAKVYLAIGNCLMGHVDSNEAMALAWMNDAGVKQMVGYTVVTWFGYGGWGVLDYFVEQPGRYSLAEAFFANHHALIHSLETGAGNQRGLRYDRDVVAFYGDPAWQARMSEAPKAYGQKLTEKDGVYTFEITPQRGADSFKPVNTNGAQRGWRPIVHWLPTRLKNIQIVSDNGLKPVITDDFLLVPNPRTYDATKNYRVVFKAEAIQ